MKPGGPSDLQIAAALPSADVSARVRVRVIGLGIGFALGWQR